MGFISPSDFDTTPAHVCLAVVGSVFVALLSRIFYCQYVHPLAVFHGPWYATSFSLVGAVISVLQKEPQFFMYLARKYGTSLPIRISPTTLLFPSSSSLKHIYRSPHLNTKSALYGTGALGPPHLFTTLDGDEHRKLRKALSNAPWTIGPLKKTWESRFDKLVMLFVEKMGQHADEGQVVCVSDKVAEFAADIMSMVSFGKPFGCVKNGTDERGVLKNWRKGLGFFGFVGRFRFFRDYVMKTSVLGAWFLPSMSNDSGMGWLMCEADRQVSIREKQNKEKAFEGMSDFLQYCLAARFSPSHPLTPTQKRAHVTLLIQAGADTTGTALGSILRFIFTSPPTLARLRSEITTADKAGYLSTPIQYDETRRHLPYFQACVKEGLRLHPPATNLFARVVPKDGAMVDGVWVPGGMEITSYAYVVQRDRHLYGDDADKFRPERWLEGEKKSSEMDASQFVFGMGARVCLGKDIAVLELCKLLPEMIRRFDVEVVQQGRYVVVGGVAYNEGFLGRFVKRNVGVNMRSLAIV
ncbi:cytochrome P450 [Lentithecium fluviatile CBS 122367]|uniref:Cytochrome P450 n=1 Tax=Lentithecium fluviatile CBS 122367 TaxID=1168545 RepID=A0A6G1IYJ9_9PLEO|nr:cytochrome P450 [Lentithecium fluviatile CBS 122367]